MEDSHNWDIGRMLGYMSGDSYLDVLEELEEQRPDFILDLIEIPNVVFAQMGLEFSEDNDSNERKVIFSVSHKENNRTRYYFKPFKPKYSEKSARKRALIRLFMDSLELICFNTLADKLGLENKGNE